MPAVTAAPGIDVTPSSFTNALGHVIATANSDTSLSHEDAVAGAK
jgi:hypothetical protein